MSLLYKIQPTTNFVINDPVLQKRVEYYNSRNSSYPILFTEEIFRDHKIGLYIVPVQKYLCYYKKNILSDFYYTPFICYGLSFYIKEAFLCGCSDYLKEPWSLEEFDIRVNRNLNLQILNYSWGSILFRPFYLKTEIGEVQLSLAEYVLFKILIQNLGLIVPRHILLGYINRKPGKSYQSADVQISLLRKKINAIIPDNIRADQIILTVRNRGYLLRADE